MRSIITKFYAILITCWTFSNLSLAQWQEVGQVAGVGMTTMAISNDGAVYFAYNIGTTGIGVKKLIPHPDEDGPAWENVGPVDGLAMTRPNYIKMAVDGNGVPYIAYTSWGEGTNNASNGRTNVRKFDSVLNDWIPVGPQDITGADIRFSGFAINSLNVPYLAFRDIRGGVNQQARVFRYDVDTDDWLDPISGENYQTAPTANISEREIQFPYLVFDKDDNLYFAYQEAHNDFGWAATVKKLVSGGTEWEVVGRRMFTDTPADFISLALDSNQDPYITYKNGNHWIEVRKYDRDEDEWKLVGGGTASDGPLNRSNQLIIPTLIDGDGSPAFVYTLDGSNFPVLRRFNGEEWASTAGNLPGTVASSYGAVIDLSSNTFYVSYRISSGGIAYVQKFECGPHIISSPDDAQVNEKGEVNFTVEATGQDLTFQWQMDRRDGNGFVDINDNLSYNGTTSETLEIVEADLSINGRKYRVLVSSECGLKISAEATLSVIPDPASWIGGPASVGGSVWTSMDVDSKGIPYVSYNEGGIKVAKLVNDVWEQVGGLVYPGASNWYPYVKTDKNDVPFVAFPDADHGNRLSVRKYNGNEWVDVGGVPGFTDVSVRYTYINFDNNNVPHVFFRDISSNPQRGVVLKYDNDQWVQVGTNVSGRIANNTSITFSSGNVPHVAYQDEENGWKVTVKKLNDAAGTWDAVGSPGFTVPGGADIHNPYLALDNNDIPYVIFNDAAILKAAVMKFNGTEWVLVGENGISVGTSRSNEGTNKIFFGHDNRPYISFNDGGLGRGVFMAFNGTMWVLVGGTPVSDINTVHYGSAMDKNTSTFFYSTRHATEVERRAYVFSYNAGPYVNISPVDTEVTEAEDTILFGVVAGNGLSYQWQVDNGSGFTNLSDDATYNGALTSELQITFAQMNMDGNRYRLMAIGAEGASITQSALLKVIPSDFCFEPEISSQPQPIEICPGSQTSFSVEATGSGISFQWQVNKGNGFEDIEDGELYDGADGASLKILSTSSPMNGFLYRVIVSGCSPSVMSNEVSLIVFEAPVIIEQPLGPSTLCAGSETHISVNANGYGLTYQWQVNTGSGFLDIVDGGIYADADTETLRITEAALEMDGYLYRVRVSGNCEPTVFSDEVQLTVFQLLVPGAVGFLRSNGLFTAEHVICKDNVPETIVNESLPVGENEDYIFQWQSSIDNENWTDIQNAMAQDYSPGELSLSTYYRRTVTSVCGITEYTRPVLVKVADELNAGSILGSQSLYYGETPGPILSDEDATGGNGVEYQWEISIDGIAFSAISTAIGKDFNPPFPLHQTTTYRRVAASVLGCGSEISNVVIMTVRQREFSKDEIPNVLLPNSNSEMNRLWGISHLGLEGSVKVRVFDKNGQTLFTSDNSHTEWNGTTNGKPVPEDIYFFSVENQGKTVSGSVKVIY